MSSRAKTVVAVLVVAATIGLVIPAHGHANGQRLVVACTAAEQAAAKKALTAFLGSMSARRQAFFKTHKSSSARKAFLHRQRGRLRALQTAAACTLVVTPPAAQVLARIPVTGGGGAIVSAAGSLWVNRGYPVAQGTISEIDPTTNQVNYTRSVSGSGGGIDYGFGSIWEVDLDAGTVTRIDPTTHAVLAAIPTKGTKPVGIAFSS